MLTGDCSKIEISDRLSKITLIVFNYDRCVEHYLYHSLKTYHHLSDDEIKSNMNYLKVIHPYGKVGFLPWQTKSDGTPYGARLDGTEILSLTDQIQTFTEQAKDPTIKHSIDDAIGMSRQIIFLGFAYHKQNLELLRLNDLRGNNKFVYGTTKGFSDSDTDHLRNTLRSMYCPATQADDRVQLTSCSCSELLDVHKFRLQN
jgi:hypothetical protein